MTTLRSVLGAAARGRAPAARALAVLTSVMLTWQVSALLTKPDDKSEIGAWSVIFTAMFAVGTVARWGSETLALLTTATGSASGRSIAKASLSLITITSLVGGVLMGWLAFSRAGVIESNARVEISLAVASVLLALNVTVLAGSWLRGLGFIASGSWLELGAVPGLTIVILAVYAQFELIGLAHVVGAYVTSSWVVAVAMLAWALRELRKLPASPAGPAPGPVALLSEHGRQLSRFAVTGLGFYLFSYLAILVFGGFGDDGSAADYRNCFTLASLVSILPTMQMSYLTPRFAELFHAGRMDDLRRVVWRSTRNACIIALAMALPLVAFPDEALRFVFGEPYVHAARMLQILAIGALTTVAIGPVYPLMTMTGLEKTSGRTIACVVVAGLAAMILAFALGGPVWVTAASVLPPLGFALAGHLALRRLGIRSAVFQSSPERQPHAAEGRS